MLSLGRVDSVPGVHPPVQPRFRLLQPSLQLKAMLVKCHEVKPCLSIAKDTILASQSSRQGSQVKCLTMQDRGVQISWA